MAGMYPDAPAHRWAWDRDGTHFLRINASAGTVVNDYGVGSTYAADRNDEDGSAQTLNDPGYTQAFVQIFPEMRTLTHYQFAGYSQVAQALLASLDTTNGIDGTWSTLVADTVRYNGYNNPSMRNNITAITPVTIKALRWQSGNADFNIRHIHLYGTIPGAADRLALWHPTLDEEAGPAHFDFGDLSRLTATTREFRVKNISTTLTANDVTVADEALTDTTPTNVSQQTYSTDGVNYVASPLAIGSLAPGAISPVLSVRREVLANASLTLWWTRITAQALTWT